VIAYANGARMLRVHDVAPMREALTVAEAILSGDRASIRP
jgi:dihydropteroate synthase